MAVQGCGLAAASAGTAFLVTRAAGNHDARAVAATAVYGLSLVTMFACSIANARVRNDSRRPVVRFLDHAAIYLLIAGTYTPFCLLMVGGHRGEMLLLTVWLAAVAGIVLRALQRVGASGRVNILTYVALGWVGLVQWDTIFSRLPPWGAILLGIGGVVYTLAAPIHRWTHLRYHDAIWHGSVVVAAACHYAAILLALPAGGWG
jgi:hemolysin III